MPDPVISVEKAGKAYRIWESPASRLTAPLWDATGGLLPGNSGQWMKSRAGKSYRDFWALKDVSFEVKKGEAVGIIGRNGAGKSTLLQLIAGTLQPTTGKVKVKGRVTALLELGAGFNLDFTGRENVHLSAAVLGLSRSEIDARFDEIATFADIGEFLDQPVKTYSSGMLMRLAFAVNTCVDPDILIVDEALGVGDAPFQAKCFRRLRQLIDQGVSLLFVSHEIGTVRSICSRALWLKNGRAEQWGEAKAVAREYEKFCWAEQGVVMDQAMASVPAARITAAAATQHPVGPDASGDFTVPAPRHLGTPAALLKGQAAAVQTSGDRYGTQQAVIARLLATNEAGEPTSRFHFNEAVCLHYLIRTLVPVDSDIVLGIRLKDPQGNFLYSVQDISSQHRLKAPAGGEFHAVTAFRLPLTHGRFIIKTGIFGFADGTSRIGGRYDYTRAVLWDIIEDGCVIDIAEHSTMPLCGPVHAHADLVLNPLPAAQV